MYDAVIGIVCESGVRLKMLLRARRFYPIGSLIRLYKCHILPYIEGSTPAYYHAAPNILKLIDGVQRDFLEAIGLSKETALREHNLAPLPTSAILRC